MVIFQVDDLSLIYHLDNLYEGKLLLTLDLASQWYRRVRIKARLGPFGLVC